MSRLIYCKKLNIEAEGLDYPPYPGDLGEKIFQTISKQAWQMWLSHQTILINEYKLNMLDTQAKEFLKAEMQKFLFEEGSEKPAAYKALDE